MRQYSSTPEHIRVLTGHINAVLSLRETEEVKATGMSLQSVDGQIDTSNIGYVDAAFKNIHGDAGKFAKSVGVRTDKFAEEAFIEGYAQALTLQSLIQAGTTPYGVTISKGDRLMSSGDPTVIADLTLQSFNDLDAQMTKLVAMTSASLGNVIPAALSNFFKRIAVGVEEPGFVLRDSVLSLINDPGHKAGGTSYDQRRNTLVRAFRDPALLSDNHTRLVGDASQPENAALMLPAADVATRKVKVGSDDVDTRPYRVGQEVDIIGCAYRTAISGDRNMEDQVAQGALISELFVKTPTGVIKTITSGNRFAELQALASGDVSHGAATLRHSFVINHDTKDANGQDFVTPLDAIKTAELRVVVVISFSADINFELGVMNTNATTKPKVTRVFNAAGEELALDDAAIAPIVADIEGGAVAGWFPDAGLTNANLRHKGQQIQTNSYRQVYVAQPHSPVTMVKAIGEDADAANVSNVLSARGPIISKAGVGRILQLENELRAATAPGVSVNPNAAFEMYGFAAFYVDMSFIEESIDLLDGTVTSQEEKRWTNACARVMNATLDIGTRLMINSRYLDFGRMITKNSDFRPTLSIMSDQYHSQFLMRESTNMHLGPCIDMQLGVMTDKRLDGKLYMTFVPGASGSMEGSSKAEITDFGWFVEANPAVLNVKRDINSSATNHIMYIPVYNFYVNLPVLGVLTIKNADKFLLNGGPFPVTP